MVNLGNVMHTGTLSKPHAKYYHVVASPAELSTILAKNWDLHLNVLPMLILKPLGHKQKTYRQDMGKIWVKSQRDIFFVVERGIENKIKTKIMRKIRKKFLIQQMTGNSRNETNLERMECLLHNIKP